MDEAIGISDKEEGRSHTRAQSDWPATGLGMVMPDRTINEVDIVTSDMKGSVHLML